MNEDIYQCIMFTFARSHGRLYRLVVFVIEIVLCVIFCGDFSKEKEQGLNERCDGHREQCAENAVNVLSCNEREDDDGRVNARCPAEDFWIEDVAFKAGIGRAHVGTPVTRAPRMPSAG